MQKDHNKSNLEKPQHKAGLKTQTIVENAKETETGNCHFHSSFKGKQRFFLQQPLTQLSLSLQKTTCECTQ